MDHEFLVNGSVGNAWVI